MKLRKMVCFEDQDFGALSLQALFETLEDQTTHSTQLCPWQVLMAKAGIAAPGAQVPALPFPCNVKTKRI